MTLSDFPNEMPALTLDFLNSRQLDPRINFSRASAASPDSSAMVNGKVQTFSANVPRLGDNGLLIEEQRTNYYPMFAQPGYNTDNNGVYSAYSDSTFGAAHNAHSWTFTTAVKQLIGQANPGNITTPGNDVQYSISFWAKANQTFALKTAIRDERRSDAAATFNLTTEWQYCTVTTPAGGTDKGSGTTYLWLINQVDVTAGLRIDFACLQMEVGGFPTSYIKTDPSAPTTTVTRAADICTITGANFSSWYNQSEGSFTASVTRPIQRGGRVLSTSSLRYFDFYFTSGGAGGIHQHNGGGAYQSPTATVTTKFGALIDTTGAAKYVNGSGSTYTNNVNIVDVSSLVIGNGAPGINDPLNGPISRISYYPTRLSNDALEALTT